MIGVSTLVAISQVCDFCSDSRAMFLNTKPNGGHGQEAIAPDTDNQCASTHEAGQVSGENGGDDREVGRIRLFHRVMQDSDEHGMLLRYVSSYAANQGKTLIRFCGCLSMRCQFVELR